jgi:hypothetical protein
MTVNSAAYLSASTYEPKTDIGGQNPSIASTRVVDLPTIAED